MGYCFTRGSSVHKVSSDSVTTKGPSFEGVTIQFQCGVVFSIAVRSSCIVTGESHFTGRGHVARIHEKTVCVLAIEEPWYRYMALVPL